MTQQPSPPEQIVLSSALNRQQYQGFVRLTSQRATRVFSVLVLAFVVIGTVMLAVSFRPNFGVLEVGLLAGFALLVGPLSLFMYSWQRRRMWAGQQKQLAAPGTVTLDDSGIRSVKAGVDSRIAWSQIEAVLFSADVLGLRMSRYIYLMVALPADPEIVVRLRELVARHVPPSLAA